MLNPSITRGQLASVKYIAFNHMRNVLSNVTYVVFSIQYPVLTGKFIKIMKRVFVQVDWQVATRRISQNRLTRLSDIADVGDCDVVIMKLLAMILPIVLISSLCWMHVGNVQNVLDTCNNNDMTTIHGG
jgi:hypothetical protein